MITVTFPDWLVTLLVCFGALYYVLKIISKALDLKLAALRDEKERLEAQE